MNDVENLLTNDENLKDTKEILNEISYKTDTIIYFQEQSYSLNVRFFAVFIVVFIIIVLYKYITSFFNF